MPLKARQARVRRRRRGKCQAMWAAVLPRGFVVAYLVVVILKQIGARIIIAGLLFGAITRAVASPNTPLEKYWPLMVFFCLIVGAGIGVLGFIQVSIEKHRERGSR